MRTGQQDPRIWALGLTAAIHALLWYGLVHDGIQTQSTRPHAGAGPVLSVVLAPPPAARQAGPQRELAETIGVLEPLPVPEVPLRDDLYFYFPHELDRQLIVLRDRSSEAEIELRTAVVMHLFVDLYGKVAAISFEGEPPALVQEQLRAAFMTMEFMPGMKDGKPVPARIKIAISATVAPVRSRGEIAD